MSRRRKNEGVGYGYTFHGAFNEKADAVKKEAKTPGSFIKGSLTAKGYRWIVMKPRKNPMRRRARVNKAKPTVKDYTQISAITGKKIRKATMVVFPDVQVPGKTSEALGDQGSDSTSGHWRQSLYARGQSAKVRSD
jgi:hypothetical protein